MSIQKALPLQIHPNKDLAARLHKEKPDQFTDPNHKPEIAVALGPFEVFAGWKPTKEIEESFTSLEPLKKFVPGKRTQFNDDTMKAICKSILAASDETIAKTAEELSKLPKDAFGKQSYILDLLPRLQGQYTKQDPGSLVALL